MDFKPVRERRMNRALTYNVNGKFMQGGVLTSETNTSYTMQDLGYIQDRDNPYELITKGLAGGLDVGGPLLSCQIKHDFPVVSNMISSGNVFGSNNWTYTGDIFAYPTNSNTSITDLKGSVAALGYGGLTLDSSAVRFGLGGTAISRCKPADPSASFGVFLAETYREGIPTLLSQLNIRSQTEYFRSLGDNYLKVEFGWRPFVSDLMKTIQSLQNSQRTLEDLRRNSGKRMRRQYSFPSTDVKSVSSDQVKPYPNPNAYTLTQQGRTVTITVTKRTWFNGEFVYRFPAIDDPFPSRWRANMRQIAGLDFSPETLWNIAPWTWLTDWYANGGDIMSNISAISNDDLTMRYGYLMQEVIRKDTIVHTGVKTPVGSIPSVVTGTTTRSVKSRIGASPYGFGIKWSDLSLRQAAILASLGFTRTGRYQD